MPPTNPVTVWHLEMLNPLAMRPSQKALDLDLSRETSPTPELARRLYVNVGGPYGWVDRLSWTAEDWVARYRDPRVELWVASQQGRPAGYFELERYDGAGEDTVEIAYFGLVPEAVGKGHGGPLLSAAIARAWETGARRVYVHTCSLDHPAALSNYEARGFRIFREETR